MKVIKIILGIIAAIFLIVGIPIIINECYKAKKNHKTSFLSVNYFTLRIDANPLVP